MRFDDLKLGESVLRAVHAEGYETPTPIQEKAIPHVLAGKDLVGCAQTGTGKTAAFALPILSNLQKGRTSQSGESFRHPASGRHPRVLVLTPTRELAVQIGESFTTYGEFTGLRSGLIFGGVSQAGQERMLRAGVDILVATPGRLMDMMNQRLVNLTEIEVFVLDEADRMLDMGFIADIRKIISRLPGQRQTLLFSATMPMEIKRLAEGILRHPVHVAVTPVSSTAERVVQSVYHVERRVKAALLMHLLDTDSSIHRVLIFTRTKHGADRLSKGLAKYNVRAEAIHGNKSQNQRQRALDTFKEGRTRVLVATDIAARGLDIEQVSHVINFELPNIPESYVHRIGRTGRAGESGIAISFCDAEEREYLRDIERVIGQRIPVVPNPTAVRAPETTFGPERDLDRRGGRGPTGGRGRGGHDSGRPTNASPGRPFQQEPRSVPAVATRRRSGPITPPRQQWSGPAAQTPASAPGRSRPDGSWGRPGGARDVRPGASPSFSRRPDSGSPSRGPSGPGTRGGPGRDRNRPDGGSRFSR